MDIKTQKALDILGKIIMDVLGCDSPQLKLEMTAQDVEGWDSLAHVQILHECELKLGIRLTLEQMSNLNTIGDLIRILIESGSLSE